MDILHETTSNRVLVVDDDQLLIDEYLRCLGEDFDDETAASTISDLEKVLFGDGPEGRGVARFDVQTRNQGEAAVEAVQKAIAERMPFSIVFMDIRMPPGMDGFDAAKRIRALDPNVNIVLVTGSFGIEPENLGKEIPPADKIFFFKKPFHAAECRQLAAALCGKWHADMALRKANEELERRVEERTAALHKLAYYDPVTRLPNQLLMLDELQSLIEKGEDSAGDSVVILLDVERFSFINETMGYDSGTELLRSIGNRLMRDFAGTDSRHSAIVGRFGSDEFAVMVSGVESETDISRIAEQVLATVEQPFLIDGRDLFLKASIGVAWHPVHGRDAASIVRCAEAALHRSMRSLDHSITYYHSEMRYRARYKFDMEAELRGAIENGEIIAYYQPQQSTETGELAGVEALARWIRPDGTIMHPGDFIPLSEEIGISDLLFESIMNSVCCDVSTWRASGTWNVPVSVNLSAHQLRNRNLVNMIKAILLENDVDKRMINLELTETVLLEDLTIAQPMLHDLAAFGVGIHIDDFGTGYSSLSYLAQLPVQTLKIDQSFIAKVAESETTARVVQAIIAMGKAMNLELVAEGVETDQQYAIVRRLGCDLVQGFFIARPMPANRLTDWCRGYEDTQSIKHGSTIVDIDSAR